MTNKAFSLMELMVVVAVLIVLGAIAFPVISKNLNRKHQAEAMKRMGSLGSALGKYAADHDDAIVDEDVTGKDDWSIMAKPDAAKAWYNALPKTLGQKEAGTFVKEGDMGKFYTLENVLFLPGAEYPVSKKLNEPLFAIAFNSRLQRKKENEETKPTLKLSSIAFPKRTVAFFEKGLPGEKRAHPTISKKDYDGNCKGTGKSFVARYNGKGLVCFIDGHVEIKTGDDLLTTNSDLAWNPSDPDSILWSPDPSVNPE